MTDPCDIAREMTDAWNRRDWKRFRELLDPSYTYTGGDGKTLKGPEAGLQVAQMYANAFPDGKLDVKSCIADARHNTAVIEFVGMGTHKGELLGIAPTGRKINIPVCDVVTIQDDKIVSEREYMDELVMLQQLGVSQLPVEARR